MTQEAPIPANEFERLLALIELDLDYSEMESNFRDLTKLAAKVAGTSISLVNLIDSFTQWSISSFGLDVKQVAREDTICQYTIMEESTQGLEVEDLSMDLRFKDKYYVTDDPGLRYYYGIPLKTSEGYNIGALCVMDYELRNLSPEKKELLEIIANEIVNRIKIYHAVMILRRKVQEEKKTKERVAHDIRGPIGGIIGLADIISMQGNTNKLEEVLEFISLIQKSGKSVLELADEILSQDYSAKIGAARQPKENEFNLNSLKSKLEDMFNPQAFVKKVDFKVEVLTPHFDIPFPKNKILQIIGNLISNSIKFTSEAGKVLVILDLEVSEQQKTLHIKVRDSGIGMSQGKIDEITQGTAVSSMGTGGEKGFGFGLNLVQFLVQGLKGKMSVRSLEGSGTEFELNLPVVY